MKKGTCSRYREPTDKELEEQEERFREIIQRVNTTRAKIVAHIKATGKWEQNCGGQIQCPICEIGTVNFSYAGAYNGHIHAHCTTPECVQWIE